MLRAAARVVLWVAAIYAGLIVTAALAVIIGGHMNPGG
jgi:hypothetical protein